MSTERGRYRRLCSPKPFEQFNSERQLYIHRTIEKMRKQKMNFDDKLINEIDLFISNLN